MSAPAAVTSVNLTLLAESARCVGTPWPGAASKEDCGGGKAARKIRLRLQQFGTWCAAQPIEFAPIAVFETSIPTVHRTERTTRPAARDRRLNLLTIRKQCC